MKQFQITVLVIFLLTFSGLVTSCQSSKSGDLVNSIGKSHIDGEVPDEKDFDSFLRRDLTAYFKETTGKDVNVEYELLRSAPTQSGMSFPKFYAWIKVKKKDSLTEEGAITLAAIGKQRFEITDYLKRTTIEQNTQQIYEIFPKLVGDKIKGKLGK